jgi:acyl carrier protein
MPVGEQVRALLDDVLQLGGRADHWTTLTPLMGSVPELDSMAVVGIITALEEDFGFSIADEEISADIFATFGSLTSFVEHKLAHKPPKGWIGSKEA